MLTQLYIRDYLLIREISLELPSGFLVLTGETGAGKSMILGAVDVLLGKPFPKEAIRKGAEQSVVEGTFALSDAAPLRALLGDDYFDDGDDELLIRRENSRKGKTRSFLNDHPLPQSLLQEVREYLLDLHGQRENQVLFRADKQLEFLDVFGGTTALGQRFRDLHRKRSELSRSVNALTEKLDLHLKDQSLLIYQLEEIERLGLKAGEEESIETRLNKLENSEKLRERSQTLQEILSEGDGSLTVMIGRARSVAAELARTDGDLAPIAAELKNLEAQLKDLAGQVRDYGESIEMDERELDELRERRGVLWEMKRKHGLNLDQIIARAGELKSLLDQGAALKSEIESLYTEIRAVDQEMISTGSDLSKKRRHAAEGLTKKIEERLRPLGFAKAKFRALIESEPAVDPATVGRSGADRVRFQIASNPGSDLADLSAVASGGESSRVLLAVKSVLADKMRYPLAIYDEIDLGISGQVAEYVGSELARMGSRHQLMVISHLPQIASSADHHLLVEKKLTGTSAETSARFLKQEERVAAIASLMAGRTVTKQSLASADELLQQHKNNKKAKSIG